MVRLPELAEADDLVRLLGLGEVGVGVAERGGLAVLGEEGEHRAGALRAARNVVFFEDLILAVAHDRVKVEVEALARDQPELTLAGHERFEQRQVVLARGAVRVAGQMGALGQHVQPAEQAQRAVVHDVVDVRASPLLVQLQRQQRQQRVERRQLRGPRVTRLGDQRADVELDQLGHQQKQPGVLGGDPLPRGPVLLGQTPGLGRHQRQRLGLGLRLALEASEALLAGQLPDRGTRQRHPLGAKCPLDLSQRAALPSQPERQRPRPVLLRLRSRARPRGREQRKPPRAELAHQRLDRGARVPEALTDRLGALLLDEVGAQRLVAALVGLVRRGEPLRPRPRPHGQMDLVDNIPYSMTARPDGSA